MKKRIVMLTLTGATMVFTLTGCRAKENTTEPTTSVTEKTAVETDTETETTQIPNPWTDCGTLEEAEEKAGFSLEVPETIGEYSKTLIQNMDQEIIQVFYEKDGSDDGILIRKGTGSDDISGDYNEYTETKETQIGDVQVAEKGNDGTISLAIWMTDECSYSVSVPGMSEDEIAVIVEQVK